MKKFLAINILAIFALSIFISPPMVLAATTDFTADGNITVTGVTLGNTTVDLIIFSGSTAESWAFTDGALTVTSPGTYFRVGSSSASVGSIRTNGGSNTCANNTNRGSSYLALANGNGPSNYTVTVEVASCPQAIISGSSASSGSSSSSSAAAAPAATPAEAAAPAATTPATTATTVKVVPTGDENLSKVLAESATIANGTKEALLASVGKSQDAKAEATFSTTVVKNIVASIKTATAEVKAKITDFVTYGTPTTQVLGAGERGGVVNSFKEAFGKLPATEADWQDVVKIGNGRWPSQTNATRETKAEASFKAIYKRAPVRTNAKDDAAVVVMAYGLRPANRNLNSEAAASKTFKAVYGKNPSTATDWDTVRAIAYSGAKR